MKAQRAATLHLSVSEVVYKTIDTTILKMEIYYPPDFDTSNSYPAIVFFFDGGWSRGSTTQFEPHARYFSLRGMVCFLVNYRVRNVHQVTPFESLKYAKSAIPRIRKYAEDWHVDPMRIIAGGPGTPCRRISYSPLRKRSRIALYHV
jgi:acetyl esterase